MALSEPVWHPEAVTDAEEARSWYAERSLSAARGFLLALDKGIVDIVEAPERWPKDRYGCRRYVFSDRYSFALIYRLAHGVEIVAVAHQSRHPDYWVHR
jgi:plasmid stabilization system protein ParE